MKKNPSAKEANFELELPRHQKDLELITPRKVQACKNLNIPIENLLEVDVQRFLQILEESNIAVNQEEIEEYLNTYEELRQQNLRKVLKERNKIVTSKKKKTAKKRARSNEEKQTSKQKKKGRKLVKIHDKVNNYKKNNNNQDHIYQEDYGTQNQQNENLMVIENPNASVSQTQSQGKMSTSNKSPKIMSMANKNNDYIVNENPNYYKQVKRTCIEHG